jgi:hypothetical protein
MTLHLGNFFIFETFCATLPTIHIHYTHVYVGDQPEEPSDTKLELPPPRKLKLFDAGWKSDDTKTFDTDRGREGDTHNTHT